MGMAKFQHAEIADVAVGNHLTHLKKQRVAGEATGPPATGFLDSASLLICKPSSISK